MTDLDTDSGTILRRFNVRPIPWPDEVAGSADDLDPDVVRDRFRGTLLSRIVRTSSTGTSIY